MTIFYNDVDLYAIDNYSDSANPNILAIYDEENFIAYDNNEYEEYDEDILVVYDSNATSVPQINSNHKVPESSSKQEEAAAVGLLTVATLILILI